MVNGYLQIVPRTFYPSLHNTFQEISFYIRGELDEKRITLRGG